MTDIMWVEMKWTTESELRWKEAQSKRMVRSDKYEKKIIKILLDMMEE